MYLTTFVLHQGNGEDINEFELVDTLEEAQQFITDWSEFGYRLTDVKVYKVDSPIYQMDEILPCL